ncbi:MAG: hypothetical protein V3T58_02220 [Candidatus Hydrothermarchaeales archaeon]
MIEFGNFGEGLLYQGKTGDLFAFDRGDLGLRDQSISRARRLDSDALDDLQVEIRQKLQGKREEFKTLAKKLDLELPETAGPEIQEIMRLDSDALDQLEIEIRQKLQEKREEFKTLTLGWTQRNAAPEYIS